LTTHSDDVTTGALEERETAEIRGRNSWGNLRRTGGVTARQGTAKRCSAQYLKGLDACT
jgi:hypothetical protein